MAHDFRAFPELSNSQMQIYYFESPHRQITEAIRGKVEKVHDGDTIRVSWSGRNFTFPIRMANLAAPELNEDGGHESQRWLEERLLGQTVDIIPTKERVEKWGRLLANIFFDGEDMSESSIRNFQAVSWENRGGQFMDLNKELAFE